MSSAEQLPPIALQLASVDDVIRFSGPVVNTADGSRPLVPETEITGWRNVADRHVPEVPGSEEDAEWPVVRLELPREVLARVANYGPNEIVLEGRRTAPPLLGRLMLLRGAHGLRAARAIAYHDETYCQYVELDPAIEEVRVVARRPQSEMPLDPSAYIAKQEFPAPSRHVLKGLSRLELTTDPSETLGTVI